MPYRRDYYKTFNVHVSKSPIINELRDRLDVSIPIVFGRVLGWYLYCLKNPKLNKVLKDYEAKNNEGC